MKMRVLRIVIVFAAMVAFSSPAAACEDCPHDPHMNTSHCVSGLAKGYGSCYGGFGTTCHLEGQCGEEGEIEPVHKNSTLPCLTCITDTPGEGFMLRAETNSAGDMSVLTATLTRSAPRD